jgi:hypothetical protein
MTNQTTNPIPATADSFDANIIPAETAARKDREGEAFKQVPSDVESTESIHTTGGYTVDTEGLVNNYATEPEMYVETPGDMSDQSGMAPDSYTIVDTFPSAAEAASVALKMEESGLDGHKISILGNDYQDTEHVQGSLNWKDIARAHGLAAVLVGLGIDRSEATKY